MLSIRPLNFRSSASTLTLAEKLEIARHLEAMGVDVIEAGFPISSEGDFESVRAVAMEVTRSVVCGLARCTPKDIERAGRAGRGPARADEAGARVAALPVP